MRLEHQIALALLLDALLGDPRWLPHPVRLIGGLALGGERLCRWLVPHERTSGILAVIFVLAVTGLSGWGVILLAGRLHPWAGEALSVLLLYTCFAARDLTAHSRAVFAALRDGDLVLARQRVAMLVGRDTARLDEAGVVRACVESVAENTVDGMTAPLFWAVIGGPVAALVYKAVNTLDSTFGYKNERYRLFGWASARLDDLANLMPARLTGVVMVAAGFVNGLSGRNAWRILRRDRLRHASPNSGHTEAAMAGTLGLRLGGPNSYFGEVVEKPNIGDDLVAPIPDHIEQANRLLVTAVALTALLLLGLRLILVS